MAHEMDLFRSTMEKSPEVVKQRLEPFALHGLAAIQIHDKSTAKEFKLTLPKICAADPILSKEDNLPARYLLCAFGRNAAPVLIRLLEKECGVSQVEISEKVPAIAQQLLGNLDW